MFAKKSLSYLTLLLLLSFAIAQNDTMNTISTSGTGTVTVEQDVVNVRLAIQKQSDTAMRAQGDSVTSVNNVLASLNMYNVTKLKTESISLQPVYNYTEDPTKIIGFESTYVISYSVPPAIAGETLDTAVRMGANRIDSVEVSSGDDVRTAAYNDALTKAAEDARGKATIVVNALGLCLKSTLTINVENVQPPVYPVYNRYMMADMTMSAESSSPTSVVIPGQAEVKANVDVTFLHGEC